MGMQEQERTFLVIGKVPGWVVVEAMNGRPATVERVRRPGEAGRAQYDCVIRAGAFEGFSFLGFADELAALRNLTAEGGSLLLVKRPTRSLDSLFVFQNDDFFLSELTLTADGKPVRFTGATETYAKLGIGGGKSSAALCLDGVAHSGWSTNGREGQAHNAVFNLAEPLRWIDDMRALGVVLVNVTMGNPYAQPHFGRPFEYPPPDGYESPEHPLVGVNRHFQATETIQRANPDLAVVGTGYSYLQEFLPQAAAANVRAGRVNIVGVGRATLAQPDFVRQLLDHGKLDRKRVCRTFSYCTALMRAKDHPLGQYPTGCPPFDKDGYGEVWKEVQQLGVKKGGS